MESKERSRKHIKLLRSELTRYRKLLKFEEEDMFSENELCKTYLPKQCKCCPLAEASGRKCGGLYGEWFVHQMTKHKNPENWVPICRDCRKIINKIINEITEIIKFKMENIKNENY